eukprot:g34672.t1
MLIKVDLTDSEELTEIRTQCFQVGCWGKGPVLDLFMTLVTLLLQHKGHSHKASDSTTMITLYSSVLFVSVIFLTGSASAIVTTAAPLILHHQLPLILPLPSTIFLLPLLHLTATAVLRFLFVLCGVLLHLSFFILAFSCASTTMTPTVTTTTPTLTIPL